MTEELKKSVQNVEALELRNCPLLEDTDVNRALIATFNKAVHQLDLFPKAFGQDLANDEVLVELSERLQAIRGDLTKQHYSIGFIGPTASGKSTSINYVLDEIDREHQPCREGSGDNSTSTMCRIRRGERNLKLFYMSQAQLEKKRRVLCEASGFMPESSDEELLARIPQRLAEVEAGTTPLLESGQAVVSPDVLKLKQLLVAVRSDRGRIDSAPQDIPYKDRVRFLNYVLNAHPSNPLLQEGEISFDSPYLPEELELFDLPGPGAKSIVDEWTTRHYLPAMNGVMLFLPATKLGDGSVEQLYATLRSQFRERIHKRVWVILTRWDSHQHAALVGDNQDTTFTDIKEFMKRQKLPASQVRFICSPWYKLENEEIVSHFKRVLGTESPIPNTVVDDEGLRPRFEELLNKGGILSLRELVLKVIPRDVRQQIMETAERGLQQVRHDLKRRFANEVRKRTASRQEATLASQCEVELKSLLMQIKRDLEPFEKAATGLRTDLKETFKVHCPPAEQLDEFREVRQKFPSHTRILEERMQAQIQSTVVPSLYGEWQNGFDGLPNMACMESANGEMINAGQAWRNFAMQDQTHFSAVNGQFPSFIDPRLFAAGGDPNVEIDLERGQEYIAMMEEKICLSAQQAVHAVRNVLLQRGMTIKRELDQLVRQDGAAAADVGAYDTFVATMGELAG